MNTDREECLVKCRIVKLVVVFASLVFLALLIPSNRAANQTGDIVIDAHPESFQLEKAGQRLFVNVPDKREIEVVIAVKHSVLARWPVASAENNFPMALDEAHHRLFVRCWRPPRLLVFDTETGKEVASGEIAGSTDDLFYDSQRGRVYVLTSQGLLEVFQQKDPDHYDRIARYPNPPHTQIGLFVPEWGKLLAAVQRQGEQSAEVRVYQVHWDSDGAQLRVGFRRNLVTYFDGSKRLTNEGPPRILTRKEQKEQYEKRKVIMD